MNSDQIPPGPLLVDTDVFSWLYTRRGRWQEYEELVGGRLMALSFSTVGELWAGAFKAGYGEPRRQALDARIRQFAVIPATDPITRKWAELYSRFQGRLKSGGVNDMWTAACALAENPPLPIVTGNRSDFETIASEFPVLVVHPDA